LKAYKILLFLILINLSALSQLSLYTAHNGLPSKNITAITVSKFGYIWIGTSAGLCRFDGYTFTPISDNRLQSEKITCLREDDRGRLWIGTLNGLFVFDELSGKLKSYFQQKNREDFFKNNVVYNITSGADGTMLVAHGSGKISRFSKELSLEELFQLPFKNGSIRIITSILETDGNIWFVENKTKVRKLTPSGNLLNNYEINLNPEQILPFEKNLIVPNAWGNLYVVKKHTGEFVNHIGIDSLNKLHTKVSFSTIKNNLLCVAYLDGAFITLDLTTGKIVDYTEIVRPFIKGALWFIERDKNGIFWIGTNLGLLKFIPPGECFTKSLWNRPDTDPAQLFSLRGIAEDKNGNIYIGGYKGLFSKDNNGGIQERTVNHKGRKADYAWYPFVILPDDSNLYIGTEVRGFYRYNLLTKTAHFEPSLETQEKMGISAVYALLKDANDSIWMGTSIGLFVYEKNKKRIHAFDWKNKALNTINLDISCIVRHNDRSFWVGTRTNGFLLCDKQRGLLKHISGVNGNLNYVNALYREGDSIILVGTRGKGLGIYNIISETQTMLTKKDGLADNTIASIQKDRSGCFWISTFNGLSRLDLKTKTINNFYSEDGLTDNEFNTGSSLLANDGNIYFGGINGLNSFVPEKLQSIKKKPPRIFLIRWNSLNDSSKKTAIIHPEKIQLRHDEKFFTASFALDNFSNTLLNTFEYRLNSSEWISLGNINHLRFDALNGGNYRIEIRGKTPDNVLSENTLELTIDITIPFYRTWWFYILIIIFTAILSYVVSRFIISQRVKIQNLRTKISSDLHDEVGGLLTRISVEAQLLKQQANDAEHAEKADKISATSRLATSAMNDILWTIDARNDRLKDLSDKLCEYAGDLIYPTGKELKFSINLQKPDKIIGSNLRQNILMIFKESLHNIVKHSNASMVWIEISENSRILILKISDNGIVNESNSTGQGLKNMKMRAQLIGGFLSIERENGFHITLHVNYL
jgi:ligand-binding sensor domain-containing protein/two-component sensor histidine kinase